jgi:hypothetical protein
MGLGLSNGVNEVKEEVTGGYLTKNQSLLPLRVMI